MERSRKSSERIVNWRNVFPLEVVKVDFDEFLKSLHEFSGSHSVLGGLDSGVFRFVLISSDGSRAVSVEVSGVDGSERADWMRSYMRASILKLHRGLVP